MSRARILRLLGLVLLVGATAACGESGSPTAPSAATVVAPTTPTPAPAPGRPPASVTFTVRSGADGLPPVPGASVQIGEVSRTTDIAGTTSLAELPSPAIFTIDAPGFLSYRGTVTAPAEVVTLWPRQAGMTDWWIAMTSYYGPDYNQVLWRPDHDVLLELQGALGVEPYRAVWETAVREIAGAIAGAGTGPTVRLAAGPGTVPVRLSERATCEPVRWSLTPAVLTPPPVLTISAEAVARDPETVLSMVAGLVGFHLGLSRRDGPPQSGGRLSAIERTAIRMRMLRPPGTALVGWSLEDTTATAADGTSGYWCR